MVAFSRLRERMVERQIASRGVRDARVLAAMREVPREEFVPKKSRDSSYEDKPLPIEEGQTISQPYIVALMIEALELAPGDRVLEIGAGTGYAAAILSRVAREVFAIERYESLANSARERMRGLGYDNVEIIHGDGTLGVPEHAPYDAIVVSAGAPSVPETVQRQLAIGGRLVIPIGVDLGKQTLVRVRRTGEYEFERASLGGVRFVPLIGSEGWTVDGLPAAPDSSE